MSARPPTPLTQQLGRIALVVLLGLFAIFAVANGQRVEFSWIFGSTEVRPDPTGQDTGGVPLIVLLLASFAIGAALGALLEWQFLRGRRARHDGKGR